jgi:hypothetical protein
VKIIAYNRVAFATIGLSGGLVDELEPGAANQSLEYGRRGYPPVALGLSRGAKPLIVSFTVNPTFDAEQTRYQLLASFDPYDESERLLTATLLNGTNVQVYATLVSYQWNHPETIDLTFSINDPIWRKATADTFGPVSWADATISRAAALATPNAGKARANLSLVIKPTGIGPSPTFKLRRTFTVTNNSDTPWNRFPLEINLGNTGAWTSTVSGNADKTWIFQDGIAQPRELLGWSEAQTYCWILVNNLAPGATATYDIAYEGATSSPTLSGANRPAFDITWEKGNATAGSATTITKAGAGWRTNQWFRGSIYILSGTGAGQNRQIVSNTATVITVATMSPAPDATSVFLLTMSHNDRWVYDTTQVERSNPNRGLWYQNRGQSKPSVINFDVPGGWYRYLKVDNNDEKSQSRTYPFETGAGPDWFNGLDAYRTVQSWTSLQESGQADGVAFSSPIKILSWIFNYQLKNPNGIAKAIFGFRENGAEGWESSLEDGTAHDNLTNSGTTTAVFTTDTRHLLAHLGPADEEVMPVSWIKDTGSVDGGGGTSSSLQDSTKSWATDQWKNGTVRIVSGRGVGQARTISGNTSVLLSVSSAWTAPGPGFDSRFEVKNKKLIAQLRHQDRWEVQLDTSSYTISAIGAEIFPSYAHFRDFRLGGGPDANVPYQRIMIGGGTRWVHLAGTEEIRVNGSTRRAGIYTTASGALVRDITDAIVVRNYENDGHSYLAPEWLLVPPTPTNPIVDPDFLVGVTNWSLLSATAGVTQAFNLDGTLGHLAVSSFRIQVTASTAAAGARVIYASPTAPPYVPVTAGRQVTVTAWGRTTSLNWRPKMGIAWYDGTNTLISTDIPSSADSRDLVPAINTFYQIGHAANAPATAVTGRPLLVYECYANSTLGTASFDEVRWNTSALFFPNEGGAVNEDVTATLTEGWHG